MMKVNDGDGDDSEDDNDQLILVTCLYNSLFTHELLVFMIANISQSCFATRTFQRFAYYFPSSCTS